MINIEQLRFKCATVALGCTIILSGCGGGGETNEANRNALLSSLTQEKTLISEVQMEDQQFQRCLDEEVESNRWRYVQEVQSLTCLDFDIKDASGIEQLTALKTLDLSNNQLVSIDLSANTLLEELALGSNFLSSIDLEHNIALKNVSLYLNDLTHLDLSGLEALSFLTADQNQLTEIDFNNNPALIALYLSDNQLTTIDLSATPLLHTLSLSRNRFTDIDLANQADLEILVLNNNQFAQVDLSQNTQLQWAQIRANQLTRIDLSQNTLLEQLFLDENQLTEIDVSANPALLEVDLDGNRLSTIDLSDTPLLDALHIRRNPLSLDIQVYLDTLDQQQDVRIFFDKDKTLVDNLFDPQGEDGVYVMPFEDLIEEPFDLKHTCIRDIDTLDDCDYYPVLYLDGVVYYAFSFIDNRYAFAIVGVRYSDNATVYYNEVEGARYIHAITEDADGYVFTGQAGMSVSLSLENLKDLRVLPARISSVDFYSIPPVPSDLKESCNGLCDRFPVVSIDEVTYYPFSFIDNRFSLAIVGYNRENEQVYRQELSGARYIANITLLEDELIFTGQEGRTVSTTINALKMVEKP